MGIMDFTLYLYIRSTHNIRGRILYTHNNSVPSTARIRPAVMARANRCQGTIVPIAPRHCSEVDLLLDQTFCNFGGTTIGTVLCNQLGSCLTQCDLACTVGIHWATALYHTAIQRLARCLFQQSQLASTRWIDWTTGLTTWCRCEPLLASTVWINRATQLCLVAELNIE